VLAMATAVRGNRFGMGGGGDESWLRIRARCVASYRS
jgi:hypothetical protein